MRASSFRQPLLVAAALWAMLMIAAPAHAQWPQGALVPEYQLGYHSFDDFYLVHGSDPATTWCFTVQRGSLGPHVMTFGYTTQATGTVQRQMSDALAFASPPLSSAPYDRFQIGAPFAPEAGGGAFYFYSYPAPSLSRASLYALRLRPDGSSISPSVRVDSSHTGNSTPRVAALTTPDSGAWCVWPDVQTLKARLARLDRNGVLVPPYKTGGWVVPGMALKASANGATVAPDGSGGILIAASDTTVRVQRISADTTIATGWPSNGLTLSGSIPSSAFLLLEPGAIVRADASTFFLVYQDGSSSPRHVLVNRFFLSGARDPNWPVEGITLPSADPAFHSLLGTPDHQGGITLTWLQDSLFYAMHLRADGTPATGYTGGPRVLANPPKPATAYPGVDEPFAGVGVCEGRDDGLFVSYVDASHVVHSRWYDGNGDPSPSPALYEVVGPSPDVPLQPGYTWLFAHAAQSDGAGGAYVALERYLNGDQTLVNRQTFAHITQTTVLATPPAPAPSHLALAAGPNPSRGASRVRLSLPRAEPAHFALYDITGRVRFSRDVAGVGEHTIALGEAGALAPGVYLARVTQGGAVATTRLAVVR